MSDMPLSFLAKLVSKVEEYQATQAVLVAQRNTLVDMLGSWLSTKGDREQSVAWLKGQPFAAVGLHLPDDVLEYL